MPINHKYKRLISLKDQFFKAKPFPYLVLDDFIDKNFFEELTLKLDIEKVQMGKHFNSEVETSKSISLNSNLPEKLKEVINYLNSEEWIKNLNSLTELPQMFPATSVNEHLANYHEMRESGNLGSHVDHSHEPVINKPHVLNIIVYLSDDWSPDYGGNTILFDAKGKKVIKKIDYKKNRAVIFLHTPYSFHGVDKISGNLNKVRRTIYVDYYSNSKNPFKNLSLSFSKKWFKHGTTFILPNKNDYFKIKNYPYTKSLIQYKLSEFLSRFS